MRLIITLDCDSLDFFIDLKVYFYNALETNALWKSRLWVCLDTAYLLKIKNLLLKTL